MPTRSGDLSTAGFASLGAIEVVRSLERKIDITERKTSQEGDDGAALTSALAPLEVVRRDNHGDFLSASGHDLRSIASRDLYELVQAAPCLR